MEHGVKSREVWGKSEEIGVVANSTNDGERTKVAVIRFERGSSGTNVAAAQ